MSASKYLVSELRRQREALGLSQEAWGERVHFSAQHVGAVERGDRPALPDYLKAIDRAFGTTFFKFYELFVRGEAAPVWFRPWVDNERDATMLRWFEPLLIPGLLQTEAYARAILTQAGSPGIDVEKTLADRQARQEVIFRDKKPVRFIGVVDEGALRRAVGGSEVMREQLHALVQLRVNP